MEKVRLVLREVGCMYIKEDVMFKCFFSYYGSKAKIAKYYPSPKYGKIIEPFCGAANYSVIHFENDVLLTDLNEDVIGTWNYLKNATESDILGLPKFSAGLDIRTLSLSEDERRFCGWWVNRGNRSPCNIVSKFAMGNSNGAEYFENVKRNVASNLYRIKHWKVELRDYSTIENEKATWFIDPPYTKGGEHYIKNTIDYNHLAEFSKTRDGRVIVCENENGKWMDFRPLVSNTGVKSTLKEVIYLQD